MEKNIPEGMTFGRLNQIGVVVKDLDKTIERLTALGLGPFEERKLPEDNVEFYRGKPFKPNEAVRNAHGKLGGVDLELIQPIGPSPHKEYLDEKGEGIQHLGFHVDNVVEAAKRITDMGGVTVLLTSKTKEGGGVAYLDIGTSGLIFELRQHRNSR
jgi:catechol 2,3-dioxygenase-like lactoylglutathione lyase family enzyme